MVSFKEVPVFPQENLIIIPNVMSSIECSNVYNTITESKKPTKSKISTNSEDSSDRSFVGDRSKFETRGFESIENSLCEFSKSKFNQSIDPNYRISSEIHYPAWDHLDQMKSIWDKIKNHVPTNFQGRKLIGPHSKSFYLLYYTPGQFFKMHRDGHSQDSKGNKSYITVLIYLTECKGGETRFYNEPNLDLILSPGEYIDVNPETGKMVLMWHFIKHEALPVKEGIKCALRFNILYERIGEYSDSCNVSVTSPGQGLEEKICRSPVITDYLPFWWKNTMKKFVFLIDKSINNRPLYKPTPSEGEDVCDNCHYLLKISNRDYYKCPVCGSPVINTNL